VVTSAEAGQVVLGVRDTGPGFGGKVPDRLWEPFYTTKPTHLGMGLPICRRIVEAHGGEIAALDLPEGGVLMRVALPAVATP